MPGSKEYMREWNKRNRERVREYRRKTADRRNARQRERYASDAAYRERALADSRARDKESKRNGRLRADFGITAADYDRMLAGQGGGCAICGRPESIDATRRGKGIRLHVDHNHETGAVRGLLCSSCNLGLGKFRDNADLLDRAAEYLGFYRR